MSGIIGGAGSKSGVIGETEIDYEEGEWTASISGASAVGPYGLHSDYTKGYYRKIGGFVYIAWSVPLASLGNVSGAGTITGLPFATTSVEGGFTQNFGNACSQKGGSINGTTMDWRVENSLSSASWVAGSEVKWFITGWYFTAS